MLYVRCNTYLQDSIIESLLPSKLKIAPKSIPPIPLEKKLNKNIEDKSKNKL